MRRRNFVLGALSAGLVSVIAAKSEPKSAFAQTDDTLVSRITRRQVDGGWEEYKYIYQDGKIVEGYFTPARGSKISRMTASGIDGSAMFYVVETMDEATLTKLHRSTMPIGFGKNELATRDAFNKRVSEFFEWYVGDFNTRPPEYRVY